MQSILLCGLGFMGSMHLQAYGSLNSAKVAGVVEARRDHAVQTLKKLGLDVPVFPSLEEALKAVSCTVVDVCLPTDLHEATCLDALAADKALFCEKPLALEHDSARRILAAAERSGLPAQVGHCIRFWPEYRAFAEFARAGRAGALLSLSLQRCSGRITHDVDEWMADPVRCGGAALDLHIHDTDFVLSLLGRPASVRSRATFDQRGASHIFTEYHYPGGPIVQAEGGWNYPSKWGFRMAFQAVFERGAVEYDAGADPTLRQCMADGAPEPLQFAGADAGESRVEAGNLSSLGGYLNELRYFIDCLEAGRAPENATLRQAAESLEVCLAEIRSAETGNAITL